MFLFAEFLKTITEKAWTITETLGPRIAGAVAVLFVGLWLISRLTNFQRKFMQRKEVHSDLQPFLASLVNVGLKVMLLFSCAEILGIHTTSFMAVITAAGFAVGLALQGSLSNLAGGVLILLFKPFRVGDLITAQGFTGKVKEIQIFNTVLLTDDHRTIVLPNGNLSNSPVENFSREGERRLDFTITLQNEDDPERLIELLKEAAKTCPYITRPDEVQAMVSGYADFGTNYTIRLWVRPEKYPDSIGFLAGETKRSFFKNKITLPTKE